VSALERMLSINDDGNDSDDSRIDDSQWVRCDKCVLNITDKMIIENGDELTDKHIQMAQYLLKCFDWGSLKHFEAAKMCHWMHS